MVDIGSDSFDLNTNWLIEASAGTGKTFTIEQLFVRRLLEPTPEGTFIPIRELAAVTFTRAAARELTARISSRIEETITLLENGLTGPRFIEKIKESGPQAVFEAKERLRQAREGLSESSLSTIHHFAATLLFEYFYEGSACRGRRWASHDEIAALIREFFCFYQKDLDRGDLELLLASHGMDLESLFEEVERELWEGQERPSINALWNSFEKKKHMFTRSEMEERLEALSHHFCGLEQRGGDLHPEIRAVFQSFCRLFREESTFEDWQEALLTPFLPSKLFAKPKKNALFDHEFRNMLLEHFEPLIKEGSLERAALDRVTQCTRRYVDDELSKRALMAPRALLYHVQKALTDSRFISFFSKRFRAIFVDEFQDTDPIQWKIFSAIFFGQAWRGFLYLVGDPKQAIYAFRKADVYNYIAAKSLFPPSQHIALTTNFRMTHALTQSLNALFSNNPLLFYLPQKKLSIEACPLTTGRAIPEIGDGKEALCFFQASAPIGKKRNWPHETLERTFFSYIAQQICTLGLPLASFAILVRDKFQAERLASFLGECNIPTASMRRESITESPSYPMLLRLMRALASPRHVRTLVELLALPPFSLPFERLRAIEENFSERAFFVQKLVLLGKIFEEQGVAPFAGALMEWIGASLSASEQSDSEQLVDLLIREEAKRSLFSCRDAIRYLEELPGRAGGDEEEFARRSLLAKEAVRIVTMHKSKGLEFDVVFALGAAMRTLAEEDHFERDCEKIRAFYVACTRAKRRLYLPLAIEEEGRTIAPGRASPIELYFCHYELSRRGGDITDREAVYEGMGKDSFTFGLDELRKEIIFSLDEAQASPCSLERHKTVAPSKPVRKSAFRTLPFSFESFSSLQHKWKGSFGADALLPRGNAVGLLLHEILSNLSSFSPDAATLREELEGTILEPHTEQVVAIFERLFRRQFSSPYGQFSLPMLSLEKSFREVEFFYSKSSSLAIRGVIDFCFEYEGNYYLIDWKCHYLDCYDAQALCEAVEAGEYKLQGELYLEAMGRYLEGNNIPQDMLKGIFFVFLRGVTDADGVYFIDRKACTSSAR
jgi:exodeoxyribonuclease V beta subunit